MAGTKEGAAKRLAVKTAGELEAEQEALLNEGRELDVERAFEDALIEQSRLESLEAKKRADARLARYAAGRAVVHRSAVDHYVCGPRPLQHQGVTLHEGDVVEGAKDWPRVEAWARAGRIVPVYTALEETA